MQAATYLERHGVHAVLLEKSDRLGGHVAQWHCLFPTFTPAGEVSEGIELALRSTKCDVRLQCEAASVSGSSVTLYNGDVIECSAVILCTGYDLFDARVKEEYGYGIYDNVYTSADLERMMREGRVLTRDGREPGRVAILHCVGSRDEKVCQRHCSRVCCVTGVKQAMELKRMFPSSDVFNFYMDIRMFGPGYEEMYHSAQRDFNVHFVRGRISEASQMMDGRVQIKAEDTLTGRPLRMSVDMLVLLVGMKSPEFNSSLAVNTGIARAENGFISPVDMFSGNTVSSVPGVFIAGTVSAPKSIGESLNEATAAADQAIRYICNGGN